MGNQNYYVYLESNLINEPNKCLEFVKGSRAPFKGENIWVGKEEYSGTYRVKDVNHSTYEDVKKNSIRRLMHSIFPNMRARCFKKRKHLETLARIDVIVEKEEKS